MVLGLRISVWKSKLYGPDINDQFFQAVSQFFACKKDYLPFKFLGITVSGNPRRVEF